MTKYLEQHPEITGYVRSEYEGKNIPCFEVCFYYFLTNN